MSNGSDGVEDFFNHNNHSNDHINHKTPTTTTLSPLPHHSNINTRLVPHFHNRRHNRHRMVQSEEEIHSTTFTFTFTLHHLHSYHHRPLTMHPVLEVVKATLLTLRRRLTLIVHVLDRCRQDELNPTSFHDRALRHHNYTPHLLVPTLLAP